MWTVLLLVLHRNPCVLFLCYLYGSTYFKELVIWLSIGKSTQKLHHCNYMYVTFPSMIDVQRYKYLKYYGETPMNGRSWKYISQFTPTCVRLVFTACTCYIKQYVTTFVWTDSKLYLCMCKHLRNLNKNSEIALNKGQWQPMSEVCRL